MKYKVQHKACKTHGSKNCFLDNLNTAPKPNTHDKQPHTNYKTQNHPQNTHFHTASNYHSQYKQGSWKDTANKSTRVQ